MFKRTESLNDEFPRGALRTATRECCPQGIVKSPSNIIKRLHSKWPTIAGWAAVLSITFWNSVIFWVFWASCSRICIRKWLVNLPREGKTLTNSQLFRTYCFRYFAHHIAISKFLICCNNDLTSRFYDRVLRFSEAWTLPNYGKQFVGVVSWSH